MDAGKTCDSPTSRVFKEEQLLHQLNEGKIAI